MSYPLFPFFPIFSGEIVNIFKMLNVKILHVLTINIKKCANNTKHETPSRLYS